MLYHYNELTLVHTEGRKLMQQINEKNKYEDKLNWLLGITCSLLLGLTPTIFFYRESTIYIFWGFLMHYIISFFIHWISYLTVLDIHKNNLNKKIKGDITSDFYLNKLEFLNFALSFDYMVASMYKISLQSLYHKNYREKKAALIKLFNTYNLFFTFLLLGVYWILECNNFLKISGLKDTFRIFIAVRSIYRSNEIIIAFYYDLVQKTKTSSLRNPERVTLAVKSMLEIILIYGILYNVSNVVDTIPGNLIRSFGISTLTDVDLTIYVKNITNGIAEYSKYSNAHILGKIDVRIMIILQIVTSLVLLTLSITNYMSNKDESNEYIDNIENRKRIFLNEISEVININPNDKEIKNKIITAIEKKFSKYRSKTSQFEEEKQWLSEYFDTLLHKENNLLNAMERRINNYEMLTEKEIRQIKLFSLFDHLIEIEQNRNIEDLCIMYNIEESELELYKKKDLLYKTTKIRINGKEYRLRINGRGISTREDQDKYLTDKIIGLMNIKPNISDEEILSRLSLDEERHNLYLIRQAKASQTIQGQKCRK